MCVCAHLLLCLLSDSQVLMVEVTEGVRSVLLPFKTTEALPQDSRVEWSLTEPELRRVHVHHSGHSDTQDELFHGRTEMSEEPLRDKDLSLQLRHPRLTDSGVYTCTVSSRDGHVLLRKVVSLSVRGECGSSSLQSALRITCEVSD